MKKKDIQKAKLLLYLGNPDNEFLSRNDMGVTILGYKHGQTIYRLFSPAELDEIENKAFEMRKKRTAAQRARVYDALYREAAGGNIQAVKEYLDRTEGKVAKQIKGSVAISQPLLSKEQARRIAKEILEEDEMVNHQSHRATK